jgi:uncharacterized membrane protein
MTSLRTYDRRHIVLVLSIASAGFVLSWYLIHHGWFARDHQWDTREYAKYARALLARGRFPYSGFPLEYPPLAIPIFAFPRLIAGSNFGGYMEVFGVMMVACGLIAVGCSIFVQLAERVGRRRLIAGVALVSLSPLLLGPVLISRYDLFPTMLSIAALTAIYFGRDRTGFVLLALGTAAKAYPAVIVPVAAIYIWRNHGRRKAIECLAIFAGVVLVCVLPFLIIAPHGFWMAIHGQASRPPQIESLAASVFLAAHQLIGTHVHLYFTHQSDNINGHPALQLASVMSIVQIVALVITWLFYAAGPATKERLLTAAAAAVCAFIAFDRVLSPQYLIWLAPLVAVIPGRRGIAAIAMVACAMLMTQVWYPQHFVQLKHLHPLESWAVISRDLLLVVLFGTLAWPPRSIWQSLRSLTRRSGSGGKLRGAVTAKDLV